MKLFLAVVITALLGLAGCGQKVSANVNCKVNESAAVDCTVTQTKGTAKMEVCWDFNVTCENGATLKAAKSCATVQDGQTTTTTIAGDKVVVTGTCDKVKDAVVANMSWSAK